MNTIPLNRILGPRKRFVLAAVLLLGACSWLPPSLQMGRPKTAPAAPVTAAPRSDVERLLAFAETLQTGGKDYLDGEAARLKSRVIQANEPLAKIQLGMMLGLPGQSFSDPARAASLCGEVTRDTVGSSPQVRSLAGYLQGLLAHQARQDDNLQSMTQRVRDEQRRADNIAASAANAAGAAQSKQEDTSTQAPASQPGLAQKLREEQKRSEAMQAKHEEAMSQLTAKLKEEQHKSELLQQKLDALTSIEKNLIERQKVKP